MCVPNPIKASRRLPVNMLAFKMAIAACQPNSPQPSSSSSATVQVLELSGPAYDSSASQVGAPDICVGWSLTRGQAEEFFALSRAIDARTYHHEYDTAPCKIVGTARIGGEIREFEINGAAKATWVDGENRHYLGCDVPACERLVLWMSVGSDI